MSLINCETNPILTWSKNCLLTRKATKTENYANAVNLVQKWQKTFRTIKNRI